MEAPAQEMRKLDSQAHEKAAMRHLNKKTSLY
jgi:hypothetical protein